MAASVQTIYPSLVVTNNKSPNKLLAFPFIGIIIKLILLIPVGIEILFLGIFAIFVLFINWFIISFSGKYWDFAYRFFLGLMRLQAKVSLYVWGITDTYPGFTFSTNKLFTLDVQKPTNPNRWLAIPFVGIFVRFILLIPYLIFADVLGRGANVALLISWFAVLFKSRFPESLYEFEKDTLRVGTASSVYILGLSDTYPSFAISMNHQTIKLLLIIAGAILGTMNFLGSLAPSEPSAGRYNTNYPYPTQYDVPQNTY